MKLRIISFISLLILALAVVGCGNKEIEERQEVTIKESENSASVENEGSEVITKDDNSKVLVVYYSATGSTKRVADMIAETVDADIFEIIPSSQYSNDDLDWTNANSRVNKEHEDESLRNVELVSVNVNNWDDYSTIYIGYPIWWQIAAWPINTFVMNNDFTGKVVIPFCTSTSSGIGESGKLLSQMAGTGQWLEGQRFPSSVSETEIKNWINSLQQK